MRMMSLVCRCLTLAALGVLPPEGLAEGEISPRVVVTSQPAGASVIIDGQDRGVTPVTIFDLTPGRHHLKYRLAGYDEADRIIDTNAGPNIERNEVLEETRGLLLLKTDPAGCDVQIDGVSVGVTPRLVSHLSVGGTYAVTFRKDGYRDQVINVKFDGRRPLVREEKMISASGMLDLRSDPTGAVVTVNGIERGCTPLKVDHVPKGSAVVKFHSEGFADEVRELVIDAGSRQTLSVALKGLPGTLRLSSVPTGARLYVNDEMRGTAPQTLSGLKPGEYEVRVELEGYGTQERTVRIANGSSASEEFRLSNVMGRLEVRTSPAGARVLLDGKPVGETQEGDGGSEFSEVLSVENLLEGEHTLTVRKDGYAVATRHPKIVNSRTAQHNVRLKRVFAPDVEVVTVTSTTRGVLVANRPESVEIEVSPGITRTFSRSEIRKINSLKAEK